MREFFINWAEKLVGVFVGLMVIGVLIAGIGIMFAPDGQGGGFIMGLLVLVFGAVYAVMMGGLMYLFFGVYRNTQKANELLEGILRK